MTSPPSQASFGSLTWLPIPPIASALFVIFTVNVVVGALPLRLVDPLWQLSLAALLIDNAPLALMGLALIHLHAYLEPDESPSHRRRDLIARFAVAATLGYLLLMPLQIMSSGQLLLAARAADARRVNAIQADFIATRQSILAANSSLDLQQRLRRLRAPVVAPADPSTSLESLRRQLLSSLQKARGDALRQLRNSSRSRDWLLVTRGIRNLICSLALAAAFAAGARNSSSPVPFLDEFTSLPREILSRLPSRRRLGPAVSRGVVDEEYFSAIVEAESEPEKQRLDAHRF